MPKSKLLLDFPELLRSCSFYREAKVVAPGVGITIDRDNLYFDFVDNQTIKKLDAQLPRRLTKRAGSKVPE